MNAQYLQRQAVEAIDECLYETLKISSISADPLIQSFLIELKRYKRLAISHWPLTEEEKKTVDIGRVAVKELDYAYPEYATMLSRLGALLRDGPPAADPG